MPRRRKIITRVIAFLLLGAIVNVAVAWGGSQLFLRKGDDPQSPEVGARIWERWALNHWVYGNQSVANKHAIWTREFAFGTNGLDSREVTVYSISEGWPMRSLHGGGHLTNTSEQSGQVHYKAGIIRTSLPTPLALIPIWPGFAINTIFYGAILWLLFFAPGSVRRAFRRRRGLCPACAYPIGTSPVCTECGEAVMTINESSNSVRVQ